MAAKIDVARIAQSETRGQKLDSETISGDTKPSKHLFNFFEKLRSYLFTTETKRSDASTCLAILVLNVSKERAFAIASTLTYNCIVHAL